MKLTDLIEKLVSLENLGYGELEVLNSYGPSIEGVTVGRVDKLFNVNPKEWNFKKDDWCVQLVHDID